MKLRLKLILAFLITSIVPILAIGSIVFFTAKADLEIETLRELNIVADLKVDKIQSFFLERRGDIATAQDYWNIKVNLPKLIEHQKNIDGDDYQVAKKILDDQLKTFQKVYNYKDLMLIDPSGMIVYRINSDFGDQQLGHLLFDPDGTAFENGKKDIFFSKVFKNPVENNEFEMIVTAPIYDFEENFIGVIALEIDMDPIYKFIQDTTGLRETGETLIGRFMSSHKGREVDGHDPDFDGDHVLFLNPLRYDADAAFKRSVHINAEYASPIIEASQRREGSGVSTDYRDVEILAAWRYIPEVDWGLVAKIDTDEAFSLIADLRNISITVGLGLIFLMLLLAFYISSTIASPISHLIHLTNKVSKGRYDVEIKEVESHDEISELSNKFRQLVKFLKEGERGKYEFITSASHQLRTPASGVRMQLGELKTAMEERGDCKDLIESVGDILDNNKRVISIINNLFVFLELGGNYTASNLTEVSLSEAVKLVVDSLEDEVATSKLSIKIAIPDNLALNVEESRFKIVLQNLIANAVLYSKKGGEIFIVFEKKIDKIRFSVKDNGIGIPKNEILKVFDKFFRAQNAYTKASVGTGLGLVISKIIIEGHGGEIGFESKENVGSTFWFELPE